MGKPGQEQLNQILIGHLNSIHETFQLLDQTPASSLQKVSWNEVIQMGDQVSKQATISGMLWTGEAPDAKALKEKMASYFATGFPFAFPWKYSRHRSHSFFKCPCLCEASC